MSLQPETLRGSGQRWRRTVASTRWGYTVFIALLAAGSPVPLAAHDLLAAYLQHGVHLKVGARHIDLTLDLTFFEQPSVRERRLMDTNADGRVTHSELDAYLKRRTPELQKQVKLKVAEREVALVPLYDPEIELTSDQTSALPHHRLRLSFFAATPPGLNANDEIQVEDQLWAGVKSLVTLQAEGADGCQLLPETQVRDHAGSNLPKAVGWLTFRCVKPPTPRSAPASPPGFPPSRSKPSIP